MKGQLDKMSFGMIAFGIGIAFILMLASVSSLPGVPGDTAHIESGKEMPLDQTKCDEVCQEEYVFALHETHFISNDRFICTCVDEKADIIEMVCTRHENETLICAEVLYDRPEDREEIEYTCTENYTLEGDQCCKDVDKKGTVVGTYLLHSFETIEMNEFICITDHKNEGPFICSVLVNGVSEKSKYIEKDFKCYKKCLPEMNCTTYEDVCTKKEKNKCIDVREERIINNCEGLLNIEVYGNQIVTEKECIDATINHPPTEPVTLHGAQLPYPNINFTVIMECDEECEKETTCMIECDEHDFNYSKTDVKEAYRNYTIITCICERPATDWRTEIIHIDCYFENKSCTEPQLFTVGRPL